MKKKVIQTSTMDLLRCIWYIQLATLLVSPPIRKTTVAVCVFRYLVYLKVPLLYIFLSLCTVMSTCIIIICLDSRVLQKSPSMLSFFAIFIMFFCVSNSSLFTS
ncbi:hypothetical protein HN51_016954 [Arachis hypogaea]